MDSDNQPASSNRPSADTLASPTATVSLPHNDDGDDDKKVAHDPPDEAPFSVFTLREKWAITAMTSLAGFFSPLTANIYLPAIPAISDAFHKSVELINLTVTVYMIVQGISPMLWGTLADKYGRRLMFLGCVLLLCLTCIGLALTPTSAYWLLMLLRCIQAAGSASTIALGTGVIVDISTRAERGGFLGLFTLGPMIGPCLGPVIGGVLAGSLGWRSIFWFLVIASGLCFAFLLLFFPETLRSLVGNGSIPAPKWDRPLVPIIGRNSRHGQTERPPPKPIQNPLLLFKHLDIVLLLLFNAVTYSVYYAITTTIAQIFGDHYPFLSESEIGLLFLAIGGGSTIGSIGVGKTLDWEYRHIRRRLERRARADAEKTDAKVLLVEEDFPIEEARLRSMPIYLGLFSLCCVGYGWALDRTAPLAVPLILQVIMGYLIMGVMNTTQTLIMDLFPSQGSSITACNNLVRCSCGAALVSIIDIIVNALGPGKTFTILGAACAASGPMIILERKMGPVWRGRRRMAES